MMNRRLLLLGLGAALLIGLLGATYALLRNRGTNGNTNAPPLVVSNTNTQVSPDEAALAREAALIRSTAVKVSEAWGSGPVSKSNTRLLSVTGDLTDNLRIFAEAQAQRAQVAPTPDKLDAARSLTQKVMEQTTERATVEVTLQISTTTVPTPPNAGSPEVTYRKLRLGFLKVGDAWKVSEVTDQGRVEL